MERSRIIALPDIQYETLFNQRQVEQIFDFLIRNRPELVISLGDMTETPSTDQDGQFQFVASQFQRLTNAGIKWLPGMGNHDYSPLLNRTTTVNNFLTLGPWAVPYQNGHVENSYVSLTLTGRPWIVFSLEWSPRQEVVNWVKSVVAEHPGTRVIISTHLDICCYPYNGQVARYDYLTYGAQWPWGDGPHWGGVWSLTEPADSHDGGDLWRDLLSSTPEIRLLLCGHSGDALGSAPGAACLTTTRGDGTIVHEILQDYQYMTAAGGEWIVEYQFDESNQKLIGTTFSPMWNRYWFGPSQSFYLPMSK
jgi:hypothetical protein